MNNQASSPSPDEKDYERKAAKWRNEKETLEKRYDTTFKVFGCLFILSGLAICLYNVPTFRSYAASKAVFIFPLSSLWWCLFGFAFHFAGRRVFSALTNEYFRKRLHPKVQYYHEEEQKNKLIVIVKQTYEGCFHLGSTVVSFWLFRKQHWFPAVMGGSGSCSRIFEGYPHWPAAHEGQLLAFYQFQLGTYVFLTLDLLVFDRERYMKKNFGELFFHHFVTILLIAFSLFYNFVPIGIAVLFVHDCSDFLRGFSRTIGDSYICIHWPTFANWFNWSYVAVFVYLRLLVLPFCLIDSMYANNPSLGAEWAFLWGQCAYLIVISCGIYSIQCYWAYLTFKQAAREREKNQFFIEQLQQQEDKHQ